MGLFIHHAFLVTANDYDIEKLKSLTHKVYELEFSVSDIICSSSNCFCSFMIGPDGSKEFWPESKEFNEKRGLIIEMLRESHFDWVLVEYGECKSKVVDSNHEWED